MKRISDQIAEISKLRGSKVVALEELLTKAESENRTLNEEEQTAFDQLKEEVAAQDAHLERLRDAEAIMARSTVRVVQPPKSDAPPLAKGIGMARMAQLLVASRGNDLQAIELAKSHFPDMPMMEQLFRARSLGILQRAAVAEARTDVPAWAGTLVYANQLASELIELVMPETVLGQLEGMLRRVPFNVRIPRETQMIAQAKWVGEGKSKPVGRGAFDFITVPFTKAALIVLLTEELARFSDPSAEILMRNGLVRSLSQFLDTEFLGNTAAVAGVSPGGILAGLPAGQTITSSGAGWQHILYDATAAINLLTTGMVAPRRPVWIMSPTMRTSVGFMPNSFGVPAFPSVGGAGTFAGYPIVTSMNMPPNVALLIDADSILYASDTNIRLDISREASVQAADNPDSPPTGMISLWQQNMIGILAEKYEWWGRARDAAIVQITGVNWGAPPTTTEPPAGSPMAAPAAGRAHRGTT